VPQAPARPPQPSFAELAAEEIPAAASRPAAAAPSCCSPATSRCAAFTTTSHSTSEYPTLLQGSGPAQTRCSEEFRSTPNCVLFATSLVSGRASTCRASSSALLSLDKLCRLRRPSDPVVEARIRNHPRTGGNPFYDYQILRRRWL